MEIKIILTIVNYKIITYIVVVINNLRELNMVTKLAFTQRLCIKLCHVCIVTKSSELL